MGYLCSFCFAVWQQHCVPLHHKLIVSLLLEISNNVATKGSLSRLQPTHESIFRELQPPNIPLAKSQQQHGSLHAAAHAYICAHSAAE